MWVFLNRESQKRPYYATRQFTTVAQGCFGGTPMQVDLHGGTPVRDHEVGCPPYTPSSNATTPESKKSVSDTVPLVIALHTRASRFTRSPSMPPGRVDARAMRVGRCPAPLVLHPFLPFPSSSGHTGLLKTEDSWRWWRGHRRRPAGSLRP